MTRAKLAEALQIATLGGFSGIAAEDILYTVDNGRDVSDVARRARAMIESDLEDVHPRSGRASKLRCALVEIERNL